MNINLNNYESFFLMYVDNEMSAADRLSVETFVQEFPYLAEELELLKGMVLPANNGIVMDKMNLYKNAAIEEQVEEAMLLYLDNELPVSEKEALLQQINNNTNLKQNWSLLQKTQLDAGDVVVFADKNLLYRKRSGRLVNLGFTRWAIAAALISAGFYMGLAILNNQNDKALEVTTAKNLMPKSDAVSPGSKTSPLVSIDTTAKVALVTNKIISKALDVVEAKPKNKKTGISINKEEQSNRDYVAVTPGKINSKKQDPANMIAANNPVDLKIKKTENAQSLTASFNGKEKPEVLNVYEDISTYTAQNNKAKVAVLEEEEEEDNDHIFLIDKEVVTQSKAGVFFKKLKRTVARTANIKTGNSLKIAGFEFAVK